MASLTFTLNSALYAGQINSRVLIGRRLSHGVVLTDPGVSRLHAWIDPIEDADAQWGISDAGSTTGTWVNDKKVVTQPLHDGDKIRIGNVTVTYHSSDRLPKGATPVELSSPTGVVKAAGILFECACGAPLWVGSDLAGKRGMCRHCRKPVTVPAAEPGVGDDKPKTKSIPKTVPEAGLKAVQKPTPQPVLKPPATRRAARCAVCHSAIAADESTTQCPDCAMSFHTECWQENFGCSSYGCPQVDVLKPKEPEPPPHAMALVHDIEVPGELVPPKTQWDVILLAASVIGSVIGAPAFGGIAAIVAVASLIVLLRGRQIRPAFLVLALVISVAGIVIGLGVSDLYYFNARHIPAAMQKMWPGKI